MNQPRQTAILPRRTESHPLRRSGRTPWSVLVYLVGFVLLLLLVSYFYLLPALRAFAEAPEEGRRQISAASALLMAVLLFILLIGLLLTFRVGRFFFPRPDKDRQRTEYVDAWAEAGRRAKAPPKEAESDDER